MKGEDLDVLLIYSIELISSSIRQSLTIIRTYGGRVIDDEYKSVNTLLVSDAVFFGLFVEVPGPFGPIL